MTDYISRADAIDAVINMQDGSGQTYEFVREAMLALKALPSADAVSREDTVTLNSPISIQAEMVAVVRCKDCRHGWYDDDIEYYTCRHPKGLNEELYGVDFCSYGERKK